MHRYVLLTLSLFLSVSCASSPKVEFRSDPIGQKVGITNRIIVKTLPDTDIDTIAASYGLRMIRKLSESMYLLEADSIQEAQEIVRKLRNDPNITLASVDKIRQRFKR